MHCPNCGQLNPEQGRFCNECGTPLARVTPSLVKEPSADEEEIIFVLRPSLIFVIMRYMVAIGLVIVAVGIYWVVNEHYVGQTNLPPWWGILIVAAAALAPAVYRHILRQREVYTLTNHKIEFTYGLIAKMRRNIPLRNVQDVTVTQSVWERLLGVGDIVIDSAALEGKIPLRNISGPESYADMILRQIQWHQR